MKFLMMPLGSGGDVFPFIGLGARLRQRGHEVLMLINEYFQPIAERQGIPCKEFGKAEFYLKGVSDPEVFHPRRGFKRVMEYSRRQDLVRDRILEHVDSDTIVIGPTLGFAARLLEDAGKIRLASVVLQPAILRSVYQGPVMAGEHGMTRLPRWMQRAMWWMLDTLYIDRAADPAIDPTRRELGLPRIRHYFGEWLTASELVLGMFPEWYGPVQPDWPTGLRLAGFPLCDWVAGRQAPDALMQFLEKERPIVLTPGTGNSHAREFFAAGVAAAKALGRPCVLLTSHRAQLPDALPAGAHHFDFAPLSQILPKCAALVHHGGVGTTAAALAAGIPQVVMPMSHDQPDNAARVVRNHWGARLWPRQFTAERLGGILRQLATDEQVGRACEEARQRLSGQDGLEMACQALETAFARGSTG